MRRTRIGLFIMAAIGLTFVGCMKVGPDYKRPDFQFQVPESYLHADADRSSKIEETDRWWEAFNDPQINRLVADVLEFSPDIQKTDALVLELQGRLVQARAGRFPALDIVGQARRNQVNVNTVIPGISAGGQLEFQEASQRITSSSYVMSVPATFELDLWGRLSRADEAARADLLRAEENRRTVSHSIVAEAISRYLKIESLERQIQLNELRIKNFHTSLNLVEKRYTAGLTGALEVRQARRSLSQAESLQPSLYQALGINQNGIAVICGKYPETRPPRVQPEDYYRRLAPVKTGLSSELLLRRPDIRAAEANLMALNARVGVAKAIRFPMITLTGNYGYSSGELDRLFTPGNELWELSAGILQPLFDAGQRKAGQQIAEARYIQGVSDYAKTVLNAFAEVENALLTRKQQFERREQLVKFLYEALATLKIAGLRYERGLVDYLTVLDAIQARFRAEEELILSALAIMQNRVTLHRALGGGWTDLDRATEKPIKPVHVP